MTLEIHEMFGEAVKKPRVLREKGLTTKHHGEITWQWVCSVLVLVKWLSETRITQDLSDLLRPFNRFLARVGAAKSRDEYEEVAVDFFEASAGKGLIRCACCGRRHARH